MKKSITLIVALFASLFTFAQQGEIIYTDFEPDIYRDYYEILYYPMPDIDLDINQDGTNDIKLYKQYSGWGLKIEVVMAPQSSSWWHRLPYTLFRQDNACPITGDPVQVGDVISDIEDCWYSRPYCFATETIANGHIGDPSAHYYVSVKHQTADGWCYGWIDMNMNVNVEGGAYHFYVTVYRMAYCDVPNYPLRVGQTDFTWDTEENTTLTFAAIHPNPTNGEITVTGKDLKSAMVYNALGQCVATAENQGDQLMMNLGGHPAGVYFVNVTDQEGKRCVKKVVKQ